MRSSTEECPAGVFELIEDVPDIGGLVGDRLVVKPWQRSRPIVLVRRLEHDAVRVAFAPELAAFAFSEPPMVNGVALRRLREACGPELTRGTHLSLVR